MISSGRRTQKAMYQRLKTQVLVNWFEVGRKARGGRGAVVDGTQKWKAISPPA